MSDWLLILAGLVTLIAGAEMLVRGAVWIALALGVSKMTVGLTVVAFGTSAPELVVCLLDVVNPDSARPIGGIALGNIFGSNVANIGLIVGLTALIRAVPTTGTKLRFEAYWMILASILETVGVPSSGIVLIVGVDRILDMCRTVVNVCGDLVASTVISARYKAVAEPSPA